MEKTTKKYIIIFLALFLPFLTLADELNISAQVDKTSLSLNEVVKYTLEVKGARNIELPRPDFKNFEIRSGPSQSSQIQIINGEMSAQKNISWWLSPLKEGKITIPPIKVRYKGKTYSSNSITLNIDKQAGSNNRNNSVTEPKKQANNNPNKKVLFLAEPEKKEIYNGEQLNVNFVLYFRTRIRNFSRVKLPEGKNFWVEEFDSPRQPDVTRVTFQGQQYNRAVIQKIAFFPTKAGELEIDPMEIKIEVPDQNKRRSRLDDFFDDPFFDDPFFSRTKVISLASPIEKIKVKPLPDNMPENFSGGVGSYQISASLDTNRIIENEAFTLSYKVAGRGNINSVSLEKPNLALDCEVFEPKINRESRKVGDNIYGTVTYDYVIIPRESGTLNIPAYEFSYFDIDSKNYKKETTKSLTVNIKPADKNISIDDKDYSREEIAMLQQDIRYISTEVKKWREQGKYFYNQLWFWLINLTSLAIFIGTIVYRYRQKKYEGNTDLIRKRNAGKRSKEHLKTAKTNISKRNLETAIQNLYLATAGYIIDKSGLPESGVNIREIVVALKEKGVEQEFIREVKKLFNQLEQKKYAPQALSEQEVENLYTQTRNLTNRLRRKI
jgi:hypothetical protein